VPPLLLLHKQVNSAAIAAVAARSPHVWSSHKCLVLLLLLPLLRKQSTPAVASRPPLTHVLVRRTVREVGVVAIATVNAPCCLAISATTGPAPRPVPPPIPACSKGAVNVNSMWRQHRSYATQAIKGSLNVTAMLVCPALITCF
jgi:hypothetical protein